MPKADATLLPNRPHYKGLPVPWVTRWDAEMEGVGDPFPAEFVQIADGRTFIRYADERPEDRDPNGILYQRNKPGMQDKGKPDFGAVHAGRHMRCMYDLLCQVCGGSAKTPDGRSTWMVPVEYLVERPTPPTDGGYVAGNYGGMVLTGHPPVCGTCLTHSAKLCPHIRQHDWVSLVVARAAVYGVVGDVYDPLRGGSPLRRAAFMLGHPDLNVAIAVQTLVGLTDWQVIKHSIEGKPLHGDRLHG